MDSMARSLANCIRPKKVEWATPTTMYLEIDDGEEVKPYELNKCAEKFLYKRVDLGAPMSKELFKKSEDLWKQLRDMQLAKCKDRAKINDQFDLTSSNIVYMATKGGDIVDIVELSNDEEFEQLDEANQKFNLEISTRENTSTIFGTGGGGLIKFILYNKDYNVESRDYTPVLLIELNHLKGTYLIYNGIMIYESGRFQTFIPSTTPFVSSDKYHLFVQGFNIDDFLQYTEENAQDLYDVYKQCKENPIEISLREMMAILSKIGCKPALDKYDFDKVSPFSKIFNEETNTALQEYFNSYKFKTRESVPDLIGLSEFRKTFRYNELTMLDLLKMLSYEYMNYDDTRVTAEILSKIVLKVYDRGNADKQQIQIVKNETNGD